jgi:transposase
VPATLAAAAKPLLEQVEALNRKIGEMDRQIEQLAVRCPEIERLRTVPGVGPVMATIQCGRAETVGTVSASRPQVHTNRLTVLKRSS